jgi:nucleoside-triphosphatase THEP1
MQLLKELTLKLTGEPLDLKIEKSATDDEDLSNMIAKVLKNSTDSVKVIVIDEIDAFE